MPSNQMEYPVKIYDEESGMFKLYTPKIYKNNSWQPL